MAAGEAAHAMVFEGLIQRRVSLTDSLIEDVAEGEHDARL